MLWQANASPLAPAFQWGAGSGLSCSLLTQLRATGQGKHRRTAESLRLLHSHETPRGAFGFQPHTGRALANAAI